MQSFKNIYINTNVLEHRLINILSQVAEAMEYLHRMNVVHGDLKPQNILFSQYDILGDDGSFIIVKVADFGSAQVSA